MKPQCSLGLYYPVANCDHVCMYVCMLDVQNKGNHLGLDLNHPGMGVPHNGEEVVLMALGPTRSSYLSEV